MDESKAKSMAAEMLKVGKTKIWVNPDEKNRIKEAMTKDDLRNLIKEGIVKKRKDSFQSKARARELKEKKSKGRKRGPGKKTGKKTARSDKKEKWIKNVRAQRKELKRMKDEGVELKKPARKIYAMIKGGFFKGKKYLQTMVEEGKK